MALSLPDILTGDILAGKENSKAQEALAKVAEQFGGVVPPELEKIILEQYKYQGDIDPSMGDVRYDQVATQLASATQQGDSELKGISVDPRLRTEQMASLEALREIAEGGGMNAADKANLSRVQNQSAQADKGRRDAILQNMSARGMGGSGMELLAQLQSSQAATDRQAQEGLDIAGMAQQRAMEALMQKGQLGGAIRSQDFGEQSTVASAQDAINRFNAANSTDMSKFNAGTQNQMNMSNAENKLRTDSQNASNRIGISTSNRDARQDTSNRNVEQGNQQKINAPQQQFQNELDLGRAKAGAAQSELDYWGNKAQGKRDAFGRLIAGGAQVGAAAAASDENVKKNINKLDPNKVDKFLKSFKASSYNYKEPEKHGDGDHVGPMAQELAKTELGRSTLTTTEDGTLGYDMKKMQGVTLAALQHLADKVMGKKGEKE